MKKRDAEQQVIATARLVWTAIDREDMGSQCIADLPAEELT